MSPARPLVLAALVAVAAAASATRTPTRSPVSLTATPSPSHTPVSISATPSWTPTSTSVPSLSPEQWYAIDTSPTSTTGDELLPVTLWRDPLTDDLYLELQNVACYRDDVIGAVAGGASYVDALIAAGCPETDVWSLWNDAAAGFPAPNVGTQGSFDPHGDRVPTGAGAPVLSDYISYWHHVRIAYSGTPGKYLLDPFNPLDAVTYIPNPGQDERR